MSLRQFLRPTGLRRRFLLALLLVGVLPLVVLGGAISITTRNTLLQQRHQHLTSLTGVLGAQIQVFLQEHIEEIKAVATLSDVASLEPQRVQPQLQAMGRTLGEFEPLAVIDPQGMVVARSDGGPLAWVGDLWLFQQVTRQGTAAWDILSAKVTERPALVIMVPIRDERGEVIGIVSGSLDLRTFAHTLEQTTAGTAGRAYIVDHAGRVVAHPDPTYVAQRQDLSAAPLVQAARAGQYPVARFMEDGEAWLGAYGAIPDWGWIVVVQHPEAEILMAATRAQRFSLLAVLIAGMGAVLVAVLLATRLSSPILQLAAAAQKLAVGDYDAHLPSPPTGDVGTLVVAFDNMRHQLKAFHEDLEHQVERRTQAVQRELAERKRAEWALGERVKELTCLYAVSRDMQEDLPTDELCRRVTEHLVPAMQFPGVTVPVIELDTGRFISERYTEELSHGLQTEIRVGGEARGRLWVYYAEDRPFLIPEEQNLINGIAEALGLWLERKRAEEALRQSERELTIRNQIADTFLTIPDKEMYGEVLQVILEAMESEHGFFGYIDEDGNIVAPSLTREIWDQCQIPDKNIVFPRETWGGMWGRAMMEKRTLCANKLLHVPEGHIPVRRAMTVPIIHQGELVGVITVGNKTTDYDGKDQGLLESIAAHIAPVLHARLQRDRQERERKRAEEALRKAHDELEKRVAERTAEVVKANEELRLEIADRRRAEEELRLLLRLAQAIDETPDFHSALEVVLDNVCETTGWDYGETWIPSDDGSALECAPAWCSNAPEKVAGFRQVTEEFRFQPNIGLPGRVWSSRQPEWLPDVSATPDAIFLRARVAAETGLQAGFGIPIIAGEDVLAVLAFFLFESREEDRHLIELVSAVAAQLGWAMQRKQAQAALIEAEKMAIAGRLAASLAHEINNPLQTVIGCLGLAEETLAEGRDASRYLQVAHEELRRTADIVAQLRDLHRPSKPEDRAPTDVNALLEQVLDLSRKQCQSHRIEVLRAMADVPALPLVADQIKQVLLNLLLNAIEAMPQGGRLQVSTTYTSQPAGVRIAFTDSGGGIAPDVLLHVFEPFYSTRPEGLGLGLFISRNIVKQHGGQIEVDSRVGEGTTFTVWLPA